MKFIYSKHDFESKSENSYILTNGIGGYSSSLITGENSRNDFSFFMAGIKAPTLRYNLIPKLREEVIIDGRKYTLETQKYVQKTKNTKGYKNLDFFEQEYLPIWTYRIEGIKIKKTIVMKHGKNTIGIKYEFNNELNKSIELILTPFFQFTQKGVNLEKNQKFQINNNKKISIFSNEIKMYIDSNFIFSKEKKIKYVDDFYFEHDSRDGRPAVGNFANIGTLKAKPNKNLKIIFSLHEEQDDVDDLINKEIKRQKKIIDQAKINNKVAKILVRASDQFIVNRDSTNSKSIVAGYPFFSDWGRDTMFAVLGSCIATNRKNDAKSIFNTFIKYKKKGLMPNMFPEKNTKPLYNTADASLLFIWAVYEYYLAFNDLEFIDKTCYKEIVDIINQYMKGTDFNIFLDKDNLLVAGSGYDQVTWMDVKYEDILPTPRHGKPVEINAFWYNALMIADFFSKKLGKNNKNFNTEALKTKKSFNTKFWNEEINCLNDVLSGNSYDKQVRLNQIWAISLPFSVLSKKYRPKVIRKVYEKLYTPYGLRSLSPDDPDFQAKYIGSHYQRDMSYHQGTTWMFPLGSYYIAYLKTHKYSKAAKKQVKTELEQMISILSEGCVGQLAEIYDGLNPYKSRGCFAQAWSVSEILRVYKVLEDGDA